MRKKTHEEYANEVKEKNPYIEVVGEYINSQTKIKHRCLLDNYEWEALPSNILHGHGCPKCSNNAHKTHAEYIGELRTVNPNIKVIGKYKNAQTKIKHKCLIDGYEWDSAPNTILSGYGCPMCGGNAPKTTEIYKEELKKKNPNIEVIGSYRGANSPIAHRCLIDGYVWNSRPAQILSGSGCPKCAGMVKLTQEEYVLRVSELNSDIEVIGIYVNARTSITHRCKIHDIFWDAQPESILQGTGCPECGKIKYANATRKTLDKYRKELSIINPNIEVLGEYQNANIPILHKCSLDGYEWLASPSNILRGSGCPKCNESHGEKKIYNWLNNHNIVFQQQYRFKDCKDIRSLPFDFYLPEQNSCIEFDGAQHRMVVDYFGGEEAFKVRAKHDEIKTQYCEDNNIGLLRINNVKDINEKLNNFLLT